jgi:anhydro-N-acetylmuramic acid kinase
LPLPEPVERYIGLMSGTSLDGVDGVLLVFVAGHPQVLGHAFSSFPPALRTELLALNTPGPDELHRAALAANGLVRVYAAVVDTLLAQGGLTPQAITALGAHGQTVRHRPQEFDGTGYTLQLNNPALLAELTGMEVVADFRSRDVAAGGQGAPLVPLFHREVFGQPGETVCVLNLGGISNLSVLEADGEVQGFDCGPGNALMDHWCQVHTGQPFDEGGQWAASGRPLPGLLDVLLAEPYLQRSPPKSTGRDLFNPDWLQARLGEWAGAAPADVQATLLEFTAASCRNDLIRYGNESRVLIVCGGGALNTALMDRLQEILPAVMVSTSASFGLPPLQVEAAAFAWLARKAVQRENGSLESVTGTRGARVLGAIYPR